MRSEWVDKALENGATHVVVMRDMVTLAEAPYFVMPHQHLHDVCEEINDSMIYAVHDVLDVKHP